MRNAQRSLVTEFMLKELASNGKKKLSSSGIVSCAHLMSSSFFKYCHAHFPLPADVNKI